MGLGDREPDVHDPRWNEGFCVRLSRGRPHGLRIRLDLPGVAGMDACSLAGRSGRDCDWLAAVSSGFS